MVQNQLQTFSRINRVVQRNNPGNNNNGVANNLVNPNVGIFVNDARTRVILEINEALVQIEFDVTQISFDRIESVDNLVRVKDFIFSSINHIENTVYDWMGLETSKNYLKDCILRMFRTT